MVSTIFITLVLTILETSIKNDQQWIGYKEKFNKNYLNKFEELERYKNFKANDEKISIHNEQYERGKVEYMMGHNKFSDLTDEEFSRIYLSSLDVDLNETLSYYPIRDFTKNPDSLSYQKYCLDPLDQGTCGCCWAFAVSAQIEAQLKRKDGNYKTYLSPQYLYDCSKAGNCKGGDPNKAFTFLKSNGLVSLANYKYTAKQEACNEKATKESHKIATHSYVDLKMDEEKLKSLLVEIGPVVVGYTGQRKFGSYKKGIFYDESCPSNCVISEMNHALLLIGYGSEEVHGEKLSYWIIKNSWGTENFGDRGYGKLIRNSPKYKNNCNINCYAFYSTV